MKLDHERKVAALVRQVKAFHARGEAFKVFHGHTNSTRVLEFDPARMVDTSGFNEVLELDVGRRAVVVEANVPMDTLVDWTLPHDLVPPIVMEFPGITVAGGVQGGAGESSSWKWGGFYQTLNWFEIVLANGEVVRASPDEHADLFFGSAGAYGTLGVMTAAEVQLVPAGRVVELEYVPVGGFEQAAAELVKQMAAGPDYVDGIMFGRDEGVIVVGKMATESSLPVARFTRSGDDWFYLHVRKLMKKGGSLRESVPLYDYLFRYDRGAFWMGEYAFKRFGQPFNSVTRRLFDSIMHTRRMYEALQASGVSQECIIQDLALPPERAVEFMEFIHREYHIYPLWLCPLKIDDPDGRSPLLSQPLADGLAINVGVWGFWSRDPDKVAAADRRLEKKVRALGGRKWLYAYAYYTEDEFWNLYDRGWYEQLRRKYHAETLPSVYEKVCLGRRYQVRAKYGVVTAVLGRRGIRFSKQGG